MEKSQEMLDKLAEKGEAPYQQAVAAGKETADKIKKAYEESGIKELFDKGISICKEDLLNMADMLPIEDISWLKDQLAALAEVKTAEKAEEANTEEECECACEADEVKEDTEEAAEEKDAPVEE